MVCLLVVAHRIFTGCWVPFHVVMPMTFSMYR